MTMGSEQHPAQAVTDTTAPTLLTEKERADILAALANSAYQRFDRLAEVSWKLRLSVWTAFAVAAGFIINADKWKPGWAECAIGIALVVGITLVVVFSWGPYTYLRSTRWIRVAVYWPGELEKVAGVKLPDHLR